MKLKVTLIKSPIASLPKHKATVAALGLKKVGQTVVRPDNACDPRADLRREAHGEGRRSQRVRREFP